MKSAMLQAGLEVPEGALIDDGKIHQDKKGNWYILFSNGNFSSGAFGKWKGTDNGKQTWCSHSTEDLTIEERQEWKDRQAEASRIAAEEKKRIQAECAEWCTKTWEHSDNVKSDHAYVVAKSIKPVGVKQLKQAIIVPLKTLPSGDMTGLQFIQPDGSKTFKTGTVKQGAFCMVGAPVENTLVICEGWATGASIHEATGLAVLVAFDAGNLIHVAKAAKTKQPGWTFIIAGDNDHGKKQNTGLTAAKAAAEAIEAILTIPTGINGTDFNDMHQELGLDMVRAQILNPEPIIDQTPKIDPEPEITYAQESPIDNNYVSQCAKMSKLIYAQKRKEIAAAMEISVTVLDSLVKDKKQDNYDQCLDRKSKMDNLNKNHFVSIESGRAFVYRSVKCPLTGEDRLEALAFRSFTDFYLNQKIEIAEGKYTDIGTLWIHYNQRRTYDEMVLNPKIKGHYGTTYNLWNGFSCEPKKGSWELMQQHLLNNVCSGNLDYFDYLINWMATAVQHPDNRAGVAVVLRGGKGVGKSIVADHIRKLFGKHGTAISSGKHLVGAFNEHLRDKIFLFADEAFWAGDKQGEGTLKALITEPTVTIEGKFKGVITVPNMLHIMMAANADWVVPASADERRYFVLEVANHQAQNQSYFDPISKEMENGGRAAMLHDLLAVNLTDFKIRSIPHTEGLADQKIYSMDDLHQWWMRCLESGEIANNQIWEQIPCEKMYESYISDLIRRGINRRLGASNFGKVIIKLIPGDYPKKTRKYIADGSRMQYYILPSLSDCRKHFANSMKIKIDWEDTNDTAEVPF